MQSIISFPQRGPWGQSSWRGSCSGHIQRELIEHFKPTLFVDICEGSGTSRDVCRDMGIEYMGFDLHTGTDFTSDYILRLLPRPADLVFSHPPYAGMIDYGETGTFTDKTLIDSDLSRCSSTAEFLEKSYLMLLNQREATREGGIYAVLIGDLRKKRKFHSFQADFIRMMPRDELISVTIKKQHNCLSDTNRYQGDFIPIRHEYLLVWKKGKDSTGSIIAGNLLEMQMELCATGRTHDRIMSMRRQGMKKVSESPSVACHAA